MIYQHCTQCIFISLAINIIKWVNEIILNYFILRHQDPLRYDLNSAFVLAILLLHPARLAIYQLLHEVALMLPQILPINRER